MTTQSRTKKLYRVQIITRWCVWRPKWISLPTFSITNRSRAWIVLKIAWSWVRLSISNRLTQMLTMIRLRKKYYRFLSYSLISKILQINRKIWGLLSIFWKSASKRRHHFSSNFSQIIIWLTFSSKIRIWTSICWLRLKITTKMIKLRSNKLTLRAKFYTWQISKISRWIW